MDLASMFPQPYEGFYLRPSDGMFIPNASDIEGALKVMRRHKITKLELNPQYFKSNDLSLLKQFDFVEELSILIKDISDITPIQALSKLNRLVIQHKYKGVIDYSSFSSLKECAIVWGPGAESLFDCGGLQKLTIHNYPQYELLEFGSFPVLSDLGFVSGKMVSLKGIQALQSLRSLNLVYCEELESLKGIEMLVGLESFEMKHCGRITDIEGVADNLSLKYLSFIIKSGLQTINSLERLINLEEVFFSETNVLDGDLTVLYNLHKNEKLKRAVFKNRRHYSHTTEQLGYVQPPEVAAIFKKKG